MMKLILLSALLLPAASAAQAPSPAPTPAPAPTAAMPNLLSSGGARCLPIAQQIAAETKRLRGADAHRLDREPAAHLLFAVDRQVGGCREVTFVNGRRIAPERNR